MYERLENCPSCNHSLFDNYLICQDYSISNESFALVKCKKCELIFTNPRPAPDKLSKYYESDTYISHTYKSNSPINVLYKLVRYFTLRKKRRLIQRFKSSGTILDYGCGTGDFLKECKKGGWKTHGIEPNARARKISISKVNQNIYNSIEQLDKNNHFDIITAWHVIEHVSDLKKTVKKLRKKLTKEGYLIIAVPNVDSYDSSFYKEAWAAYDIPRHLYHFSSYSFLNLAKSEKLDLVKVFPMTFDSYYVSMLSEKYKTGKNHFIRGFINGWKSNIKAAKTGNYSSLIYVLKNNK